MSEGRTLHAARLAAEMRTPLARIELAASALEREVATPRARGLTADISDAVAALDGLLERMLTLLAAPGARGSGPLLDLAPLLGELHARLAPALRARGIEWTQPGGAGDPARVHGDGALARRAALALLRAASAGLGAGSRLELAWQREGDALGLAVRTEPAPERDDAPAWQALERFALACGARIDRGDGARAALVLWLPAPEASCRAS